MLLMRTRVPPGVMLGKTWFGKAFSLARSCTTALPVARLDLLWWTKTGWPCTWTGHATKGLITTKDELVEKSVAAAAGIELHGIFQPVFASSGIWVKQKVSWTLKFAVLSMHGWLQEPCLLNIVAETCYLEHPGEHQVLVCLQAVLENIHFGCCPPWQATTCVTVSWFFPVLVKILAHVKLGCFLYRHSLNLCNRTLTDLIKPKSSRCRNLQ